GACITLESLMKNVLPINTVAMALGLHPRCGIEDTIIDQKGNRMTSVQQVEQCVRIARELGRDIATGKEAKAIYKIGVQ
ncbi:3-keto-5-aminohexanoate cleavage protein, partial [Pseudomonas sp. SIMBA_064]